MSTLLAIYCVACLAHNDEVGHAGVSDRLTLHDPDAVQKIKDLIPVCASSVSETGTLTDGFMDLVYYQRGGVFAQVPNAENEAKDTSEAAPVNHRWHFSF